MQLNLQLMLAYLDDLLEPAEAAQVAEQLEASETAPRLLNRIRDVVRRLRLSAPAVSGSEMGLDPNTVAEYLDRTMPAERLADVEGVCLDSDMHLAEAAACHQIVALSLGEPAQVDMLSRRRMYALGRDADPAASAAAASAKNASSRFAESMKSALAAKHVTTGRVAQRPAPPSSAPVTPTRELLAPAVARPETARPTRPLAEETTALDRGEVRFSAAAAPAAALRTADRSSSESPGRTSAAPVREPRRDAHSAASPARRAYEVPAEIPAPAFSTTLDWRDDPEDEAPPVVRSRAHLFPRMALAMTMAWGALALWPHAAQWWEGPKPQPSDESYEGLLPDETMPLASGESRPVEVAAAPEAGHPPESDPVGPAEAARPTTQTGSFAGSRGALAPYRLSRDFDAPPPPPASHRAIDARQDSGAQQVSFHLPHASKSVPRDVRSAVALRPTTSPAIQPTAPVEVGQLVSTGQVMLRQGADRGEWKSVPTGARLSSGDRLVAPPQFRPTILLGDGLLVELPPETQVELLAPDADETPGLKIAFGRLVVRGNQRSRGLRVSAAAWNAKLAFEGETGSLALEVRPFRSAGTDPETETARSAVDLYCVRGRAFVDDGVSLGTVDAPSRTVICKLPGERVEAGGDTPAWSHAPETFTVEDLRATTLVSSRMAPGEAAVPHLMKSAVDRQHPEVRQLAARWLGCLGEFQALVACLSDPDLRPGLREQSLRALRDGLARGPEWATLVRVACRQTRGDAGDDRYRLLWGFTPEQLSEGGAERLLAGLDHNDLDVRALSFWNLQACTGHSLYYRPELPASQRRQSIDRWRERLSRNGD